jgi:NADH:ubiquinone oxidoreductase subunit 2 (subunit N)
MLAIVGIVNAAVAAGYYLRIIATMYFRTPLATSRAQGGGGAWLAAVVAALVVIAIGVYSGPLIHAAGRVSTSIDQSAVEVPR